ncbi:MAG TPA: FAD:protein FMN transferase, partial [Saprospiraceae bacterium]|nr:FAD:protein FMN transferase [Saprospiraceae bacterium]
MSKKWNLSYKLGKPFLIALLLVSSHIVQAQVCERRDVKLMGCHFDITVVESDEARANYFIDLAIAEISRIEKLISSWDPTSETSEINRNSGIRPVKVDLELFQLIQRSIAISQLTDGAFDISFASMDRIWKFDGSMKSMPSKEEIAASVKKVGYRNIEL